MKTYKAMTLRTLAFLLAFVLLTAVLPITAAMLFVEDRREPVTRDEMAHMVETRRDDIIEYIRAEGYVGDDDIDGIYYVDRDEYYGHGAVRFRFDPVEYGADRFIRILCYVSDEGEARWLEYWLGDNEYNRNRGYEMTISGDRITWSQTYKYECDNAKKYCVVYEITIEKLCDNFYYFADDKYYVE